MLYYSAVIHPMNGKPPFSGWIRTEGALIAEMGQGSPANPGDGLDCRGYHLYPGFLDIHTHLGMQEDGLGFEGEDINEESDPVTPHLRAVDAFNPMDRCFQEAVEAGVTTVITGPGSANPVAGVLYAVKTFSPVPVADQMVIRPAAMKFALGENPKSVYHEKNASPMTRMATASAIREALWKARRYLEDKEAAEKDSELSPPDLDMKSEALLPVLKREIQAHFHCHRADDIATAIRIAKEFSLNAVLIHCTEGHLIAPYLAQQGIPAVVGPILSERCKPELRNLELKNAACLKSAGVSVALTTDHSVVPIQYLPLSAGLAVRGGLSHEDAMEAITSQPARIAGLYDRVGSLEPGKDADMALFDGDPLDLQAIPRLVVSSGWEAVRRL